MTTLSSILKPFRGQYPWSKPTNIQYLVDLGDVPVWWDEPSEKYSVDLIEACSTTSSYDAIKKLEERGIVNVSLNNPGFSLYCCLHFLLMAAHFLSRIVVGFFGVLFESA